MDFLSETLFHNALARFLRDLTNKEPDDEYRPRFQPYWATEAAKSNK